ncbi:hypothetical protein CDL12_09322 [Handroanthus impetiginosus]|uniref:Ubiquitinyl hydrolase 1 n=1 Tax=Handroanthus impetiginosus TaxID=429701 RepID=A0A2G9HKF2_9LAMI|nr:hypothetical protein CDL12_09322 [Handroanthus impetiginosus]
MGKALQELTSNVNEIADVDPICDLLDSSQPHEEVNVSQFQIMVEEEEKEEEKEKEKEKEEPGGEKNDMGSEFFDDNSTSEEGDDYIFHNDSDDEGNNDKGDDYIFHNDSDDEGNNDSGDNGEGED